MRKDAVFTALRLIKFKIICLFVKDVTVNLRQASELNLYKEPMDRRPSCRIFVKI